MFPGQMVAPGIALGPAVVWAAPSHTLVRQKISRDKVTSEITHFHQAQRFAARELSEIAMRVKSSFGAAAAGIFAANLRMLNDEHFSEMVVRSINQDELCAASAVQVVIDGYIEKLVATGNDYFAARADDLRDSARRLQKYLHKYEPPEVPHLSAPGVLVVDNLSAAEVVALDRRNMLALVMIHSAPTSHAALLAATFGIPVVAGAVSLKGHVETGDMVIVDGNAGGIIVRPSELALRQYQTRRDLFDRFSGEVSGLRELSATTPDGRTVRLTANIGMLEEVPFAIAHGADGIGLVRTEFYYLAHTSVPDEDEQFAFYREIVQQVSPRTVTFRTFDLGGDKSDSTTEPEENPMLGCRGVRLLLEQHDLLESQLRALLRASEFGPIRIMFPLITSLTEFQDTMRIVESVKHDLRSCGTAFDASVPFGCMIETPAAATIPDLLAQEAEFFSIGSNDLIQYTLAADRTNPRVAHINEPLHLAVLRMMRSIVRAAHRQKRSVSLCGEMAADPIYAIFLLGLGVDELSLNPVMIPAIKQIIRSIPWTYAQEIARDVLRVSRAKDVQSYLEERMATRFPQMMSLYTHAHDDTAE